jgi:CHASE3 domain sensor protein
VDSLSQVVAEKIEDIDRTVALKRELHDAEALAVFGGNRGNALMDEANVFLSSIIRTTDERLTSGLAQQRLNAAWLRWVSLIEGVVIILVAIQLSYDNNEGPRTSMPSLR